MMKERNETWLASRYKGAKAVGDKRGFKRIVGHSAEADADSLFVCLKGYRTDGHEHAKQAYALGCRSFLCERVLDLPLDASQTVVRSVREHLSRMLMDHYELAREDFVLCAVTGTKGKTTTALMLSHILNASGVKAASATTLGLSDTDTVYETKNTTADLFTLIPWLASLQERGVRHAVIEVSSAALATGRLWGMEFDLGILTSFSKDHIGKGEHASIAEYLCAKRSLFTSYGIKTAIYPSNIYRGAFIVSDAEERIALEGDEKAVYSSEEREVGQSFSYRGGTVSLRLPGEYNRTNARLALCAASVLTRKDEKDLVSSLSSFSVRGRYEEYSVHGVRIVIDYAHNEESFFAVSRAASGRSPGKCIAVFGSVGDRGEGRRYDLASAAEKCMAFSVITADNPGKEGALRICSQIHAAFGDKSKARIVTDRIRAIRYAFSLCRVGDTLLLLGKGHECIGDGGEGGRIFERDILKTL